MKAIVYHKYGSPDILEFKEVDTPTLTDDRVLVRVRAASLNPFDWHYLRGKPLLVRIFSGLFKPKSNRLGADLAGVVEAVGKNITSFKPGDEVFGESLGAFAEFVTAAESKLAPKPASLTFEQAAAVPMVGFTALQGLRDVGKLQAGQKLLINGASGGIGTFAIQIAKAFGAEVTGVCSTRNVELVKSLGADHVIDYTKEDFTTGEPRFDLMLDNIGNHSLTDCRRVLKPEGSYVGAGADGGSEGPIMGLLKMFATKPFVKQKLLSFIANPNREDLIFLTELIEAGKLKPVIDRAYSLAEIPEAIRYLETSRARGKIVITV